MFASRVQLGTFANLRLLLTLQMYALLATFVLAQLKQRTRTHAQPEHSMDFQSKKVMRRVSRAPLGCTVVVLDFLNRTATAWMGGVALAATLTRPQLAANACQARTAQLALVCRSSATKASTAANRCLRMCLATAMRATTALVLHQFQTRTAAMRLVLRAPSDTTAKLAR